MRAPYCHLWPVWLYHIFPHYLINGMNFAEGGGFIELKMCVLILFTTFETFLIVRIIQQVIDINVHRSSCKVSVVLLRF